MKRVLLSCIFLVLPLVAKAETGTVHLSNGEYTIENFGGYVNCPLSTSNNRQLCIISTGGYATGEQAIAPVDYGMFVYSAEIQRVINHLHGAWRGQDRKILVVVNGRVCDAQNFVQKPDGSFVRDMVATDSGCNN